MRKFSRNKKLRKKYENAELSEQRIPQVFLAQLLSLKKIILPRLRMLSSV